jgi:hypothetical protein
MRKMPDLFIFFNRLRIADVRRSFHFIADDFLRFALKPACALLPPHGRPAAGESTLKKTGVQLTERGRSLRTEKSVPATRFWDFHTCP